MKNKILLLEDDESLRRAVSLKLSKENYMAFEAADIKTAAALYHEHLMPLIICDINLPDGSGLDFCGHIRAKSNVFFLFLTAFDTETDMIKGYEAGADDYMAKPFSLAILISKVNAMMKRCSPETRGTFSAILSSSTRKRNICWDCRLTITRCGKPSFSPPC